ncbi:acyl-CoA dehydrogenase family protein [Acuticoccus mangrovi]|uniref:Acyl-CoA dehydrogenase family protein n=1 Tax=Acuticoccus mangrovi TaxID=2796142 RepID=A0A934ME31_9HYPH|nr:acyl-CoA dehydrogenase family protein [Acuticoccus mangrovi]MBJ3777042.1 acyl-CoA dehydrogenase family protein [Acuticoccus mangrovi]
MTIAPSAPAIDPEADLDALPDETFRLLVRRWIEENYPDEIRHRPKRLHWKESSLWYFKLAEKGWLCPGWPKEHGGMGLSPAKQIIMVEEQERYGCARIADHGIVMLGPLLIQYGTDAQRERFLPAILRGEHVWAQGYSEPNAGSDLASLRTRAVREGDHYVVNGQKTWTTLGMDANWMFMLVRTDPNVRQQAGISFLLVPMDSPGITLRPIKNLDLHEEFAEVFFDDVKVPVDNRVGPENHGWTMAKSLLGFERIFVGSPKQSENALTRLSTLADHLGIADDPVFRDRYARLAMRLADLKALYAGHVDIVRRGGTLGADVSILKIVQTELYQAITVLMADVSGLDAARLEPLAGGLNPGQMAIQSLPTSIYAGSNEIQRNILAKVVLGLPSS